MALVEAKVSSSSSNTRTWQFSYDVFLNFRGKDTRYGFTGNLHRALIQKGIRTFMDDEGLSKGEDISFALVKAIEGSRVSIVVFSQNYAASRWCLDELIKILDCMNLRKQLVIPVFYRIDPSVVRNLTGSYEKSMAKHRKKLRDNKEKVNRWRSAVYQVANLSGWHWEFGYEFEFIQNIVEDICRRLKDPIFLEFQTTQVSLQSFELKDDAGNKGFSEVASSQRRAMKRQKVVAVEQKKFLFFGNWRSEATADTRSSSMVCNCKAEATNGGAKNAVSVGNSSRASDAAAGAATSSSQVESGKAESTNGRGKGTIGTSYKVLLEDGTVVFVKSLKNVKISEKEFKGMIEILGAMAHENLMPLRGYYFTKDEKLLFYDYMPMGCLSALLHGRKGSDRTPLPWGIRFGIALGAARGIEYIHSRGPTFCHGNIKASNILLTKSYDALVSDFGLAVIGSAVPYSTRDYAHCAPEVSDSCNVSQKADVHSFGILLMEILTGISPTYSIVNEEGMGIPIWIKSVIRKEWAYEVFDVEFIKYHKMLKEMAQLLQLALDCTAENQDNRPSMSEVTKRMEELPFYTLKR